MASMEVIKALVFLGAIALIFSAVLHAMDGVLDVMKKAEDYRKERRASQAALSGAPQAAASLVADDSSGDVPSAQESAEAIGGDIIDGLEIAPER